MPTCPNCGEIVMEGDPYCSNCGITFNWVSDDEESYEPSYGYGGYRSDYDSTKSKKRHLEYLKRQYEDSLNQAREAENGENKLKYYGETVENARRYWEESERCGCEVDGMPEMSRILSDDDVDWIGDRHYDDYLKLHIISRSERQDLEDILKATNNRERIRENEERRRRQHEIAEKNRAIQRAKSSREDYLNSERIPLPL